MYSLLGSLSVYLSDFHAKEVKLVKVGYLGWENYLWQVHRVSFPEKNSPIVLSSKGVKHHFPLYNVMNGASRLMTCFVSFVAFFIVQGALGLFIF